MIVAREVELRKLIRSQARDDQARSTPRRARVLSATDLGLDLDRMVPRRPPPEWIYREAPACRWAAELVGAAMLGVAPCPACGGGAMRMSEYCEICDRAGPDGRIEYPGLEVGARLDPTCPPEYLEKPRYRRGRLRGGK